MKQINLPLTSYQEWLPTFLKNPFDCVVSGQVPKGKVIVGLSTTSDYNESALSEIDNVVVTNLGHFGGSLVMFEDGIILAYFSKESSPSMLPRMVAYLKSRGINATANGNDILCDGYKVGSESRGSLLDGKLHFYGLFLTVNADANIINKLCTKTMKKVPRGLSYYGVTRKELMDVLGLKDKED